MQNVLVKYMSFLIKDELLKNTMKSEIKSATVLKRDLQANQCTKKNT